MKSIPLLLMILMIIGCSSNWATNSTDQENETATFARPHEQNESLSPLAGLEPGSPLCETENFGFVELRNHSRVPVRCVIGDDISVIVRPNILNIVQVPMGYREIQWWPTELSYYTCTAAVAQCKTISNQFDPAIACHSFTGQ